MPTVLRAISHKWNKKSKTGGGDKKEKDNVLSKAAQLNEDFDMPEYEQFDDYLEMVIEFGFITLFASSFPLCSLLSFFCNLIEIKSDLYKLSWVVQRPSCRRRKDIGVWEDILHVQAWMAILTNVLIFGVTSRQINVWFPSLFDVTTKQALKPQWVTITMFGIEHVVAIISFSLCKMIPDVPSSVNIEMKRLSFEKAELLRLVRAKKL
jgi:anoctamin-10